MLLYVANLNCFNAEGIIWRGKVSVKAKYAITISHMSKFSTFSTSLSCQLVVQDESKFLTKMESHFLSLQVSPQNVVTSLVMNCLVCCLYCFCLLITYQWKCFESFRKLQFNSVNFVTHELVCCVWLCILIFFSLMDWNCSTIYKKFYVARGCGLSLVRCICVCIRECMSVHNLWMET